MAEELELIAVDNAAVISAQSRAEIDMQIATAHMYPREMSTSLQNSMRRQHHLASMYSVARDRRSKVSQSAWQRL